jgi:RimJ/RimL family protein N-acetyltransferase
MLPLNTPRLRLRHFVDEDCERLAAYRNDPEVARYQSWEHCTLAEAPAIVNHNKHRMFGLPGDWLQIAIALGASDLLIGDLAVKLQDRDPRQAIIGFTIARAFHRQGYATEAVSALFDYLFRVMGLHRVTAECDTRNAASWGLMAHLGMRREAHNVQSTWFKGEWSDDYVYALLSTEWQAGKGATGK